jgi:CO/xanthine dehydrogenase FAD-binding subunit
VPLVAAYHRPTTLADALDLLSEPNRVVLAGGTTVNADREPSDIEVVDLQALGLGGIHETDAGRVAMGATTTLTELTESELVPDLLRRLARAEQPSTLRTLATVGGVVAGGGGESVLLAALLVHDAHVELAGADDRDLAGLLATGIPRGAIVTAVSIDPTGAGGYAATGRTPADVPIVAAVARHSGDGSVVGLTGVADTPVLVDPSDPLTGLDPAGDFRGSREYRLHLARTLTDRVLEVIA